MSILRVLSDRRVVAVLGALAAAGVGLAWISPHLITAAIPLLIVAACPVSMVVMMRTMGGTSRIRAWVPIGPATAGAS